MQDITNTQTVVVWRTLDIIVVVNGGELMPSLFVHDGVHSLNGDILLKQTLASVASGYDDTAPPSNSSDSMRMVVQGATRPTTCWWIVYVLISMHVLVAMHIDLLKYMFSSS